MDCYNVDLQIVNWLKKYSGFVVGISGGVDSSLVSTLCARTSLPTIVVSLPIHQPQTHLERAHDHIDWLKSRYPNVTSFEVDLTETFETFKKSIPVAASSDLALVNARSRLRMTTLYNFANSFGYIVAGTGNKVEDYGVAFFTKYGDGGVDISPIGDLLKTEVWELSKYLGVIESIVNAKPTDGLWEDDRSDEDQIGASYPELEWALNFCNQYGIDCCYEQALKGLFDVNERQAEVLKIYLTRHSSNAHKMSMPPICKVIK